LNFIKWAFIPRAVQKYEQKNRNNKCGIRYCEKKLMCPQGNAKAK
jgi:hypothetical protein